MNQTKNILCLSDASKISGYHQDYLSYLIRKGKLKGQKVGRSWVTSKEDLQKYMASRSPSPFRDIIFSRIGLAIITGISLVVVICITFVVAFELASFGSQGLERPVQDTLDSSSVNFSPTKNNSFVR